MHSVVIHSVLGEGSVVTQKPTVESVMEEAWRAGK